MKLELLLALLSPFISEDASSITVTVESDGDDGLSWPIQGVRWDSERRVLVILHG